MAAMTNTITTEVQDHIGIVRLNRPEKRNAFTPEMELAMRSALEALDANAQVKCMLIVGAAGCFSAGIDLAVLKAPGMADQPYDVSRQHRFAYIPRLKKPVVAAIAGPCYGLAAAIALLCDWRHVADDVKICMPFTRMRGIAEFGLPVTIARVHLEVGIEVQLECRERRVNGVVQDLADVLLVLLDDGFGFADEGLVHTGEAFLEVLSNASFERFDFISQVFLEIIIALIARDVGVCG